MCWNYFCGDTLFRNCGNHDILCIFSRLHFDSVSILHSYHKPGSSFRIPSDELDVHTHRQYLYHSELPPYYHLQWNKWRCLHIFYPSSCIWHCRLCEYCLPLKQSWWHTSLTYLLVSASRGWAGCEYTYSFPQSTFRYSSLDWHHPKSYAGSTQRSMIGTSSWSALRLKALDRV